MKFIRCMRICTLSLVIVGFFLVYVEENLFGYLKIYAVIDGLQHGVKDELHHSYGILSKEQFTSRSSNVTQRPESALRIISEECAAVLNGDVEKIAELRISSKDFPWRDVTNDKDVIEIASNCTNLYKRYNFDQLLNSNFHVSKEELEFSIAYSILAHENVNQILVLLGAIYRKHNIHCIHLDAKAKTETIEALQKATSCLPNVFIARKREKVIYAHVSRLLADISCMKDLLVTPRTKNNWKYLINLCSQDFPLRTNKEIVDQLNKFRGFNSIGGQSKIDDKTRKRTKFVYSVENITKNSRTEEKIIRTSQIHALSPFNMTIVKNLAYNFYTRDFLKWALVDSQVGSALLNWSMDTYSPDEHYWLMLHIYPGAPGGSQLTSGYQLARRIKWWFTNRKDSCHGIWRHYICVFGAEDIQQLTKARELFVNKLDVTLDNTGPTCLRQWLDERILTPNYLRSMTNPDRTAVLPPENFYL